MEVCVCVCDQDCFSLGQESGPALGADLPGTCMSFLSVCPVDALGRFLTFRIFWRFFLWVLQTTIFAVIISADYFIILYCAETVLLTNLIPQ